MKELSIVVPVSGTSQDALCNVRNLLRSLKKLQEFFNYEVLICVNPVNEVLQKNLIAEFGQDAEIAGKIQVIQIAQKGVNFARNKGLALARHEYILFLDDDCELLTPLDIVKIFERLNVEEENLLAVGGRYLICKSTASQVGASYYLNQMQWLDSSVFSNSIQRNTTNYSRYLLGGFFIMKKSLAIKNDLQFDEKIIFGGTEKDFFLRAFRAQLKILLFPVLVQHRYDQGLFTYMQKSYKQGRGQAYIENKLISTSGSTSDLDFHQKSDVLDQTFYQKIFNFCFWWGYFSYKKQYFKALGLAVAYPFKILNVKRYQTIEQLKK